MPDRSTKTNMMDYNEMINRFDEGENALSLSIERWERIYNAIPMVSPDDITLEQVGCDTDALCYIYRGPTGCGGCPYKHKYSKSCDDYGMHWHSFDMALEAWSERPKCVVARSNVRRAALKLINALKALRFP